MALPSIRTLRVTCVALVIVGLLSHAGHALTVGIDPMTCSPGSSCDVCVSLAQNQGDVSGIQMDLNWQSSCLTMRTQGGGEGLCVVDPGTNRDTFKTKIQGDSLRVITLSISDTSPMPASVGSLFCCTFLVPDTTASSCVMSITNAIASDPHGQRIPLTAVAGSVAVSSGPSRGPGASATGGAPRPPGGSTPVPAVPGANAVAASGSASSSSGGGCQMQEPTRAWPLLGLLAAVGCLFLHRAFERRS